MVLKLKANGQWPTAVFRLIYPVWIIKLQRIFPVWIIKLQRLMPTPAEASA